MKIKILNQNDSAALESYCKGQNNAMTVRANPSIRNPTFLSFESLQKELSNENKLHVCLAVYDEEDGRMVGGICGVEKSLLKYHAFYLHSMWCDPSCQGKGIAKTVMRAAIDWAEQHKDSHDLQVISSRVHVTNIPSRKVHYRNGFTHFQISKSAPGNLRYGINMIRYFNEETLKQKLYRWKHLAKSYVKYLLGQY